MIGDLFQFLSSYNYLAYLAALNAILALSVYIMLMAGQLSLASMGFMAIGAYTSALLTMKGGVPFAVGLLGAAMLGGIVALAIGKPILRLKGVYLAITTVGFSELIRFLALNWDYLGGAMGLNDIPQNTRTWHVFLYLAILIFLFHRLDGSRYGRALRAIGLDETAAKTMGIPTARYKTLAFAASAVMAALAGSFSAHYSFYISPSEYNFSQAVLVLIFAVFGGLGTHWGPVLGAIVLTLLPEVFRVLQDWRPIIYGISVLLVVIFFPGGLVGLVKLMLPGARRKPTPLGGGKDERHGAA